MAANDARRGRVVLAIDTGSLTAPALETAAALASALGSDLAALFVEDERLLRLAALPFAREIGFPSAQSQPIGLPEMEQAFRVQAEHLRRMVGETARRFTLAWTLDVARGEILSASFARLGPEDSLVVAKGPLAGFELGGRLGERDAFHALAARPVVVLFDDSAASHRALGVALAIAQVIATEVAILIPARDAAAFGMLSERAADVVARHGVGARQLLLPAADVAALARAVKAHGGGMLVLSDGMRGRALAALAELIEHLGCPVVVVPA